MLHLRPSHVRLCANTIVKGFIGDQPIYNGSVTKKMVDVSWPSVPSEWVAQFQRVSYY